MSTTPRTIWAAEGFARTYGFDFSRFSEFRAGEVVASASVAATPSGLTLGAPAIDREGVQLAVSGGAAGTTYTLTCTVTTSGGATLTQDGYLAVE